MIKSNNDYFKQFNSKNGMFILYEMVFTLFVSKHFVKKIQVKLLRLLENYNSVMEDPGARGWLNKCLETI